MAEPCACKFDIGVESIRIIYCPMHAAAGDMLTAVGKFLAVVDESEGIVGWHLSGADALWSDFDFIEDLRAAAACSGAPRPDVLEAPKGTA